MFSSIFAKAAPKADAKKPPRDAVREFLETIVFVVVLVFLLKQFVVEAFVIPTGSMAETLYGYQKSIECSECGFKFPLNSSREVEGDQQNDGARQAVVGYCCPNCRYKQAFTNDKPSPFNSSGDRVLVHKAQYHKFDPTRGDVVVFKFPQEPQKKYGALNYIKRLWGFGGETIAIWRGDTYVAKNISYPPEALNDFGFPTYPRPDRPEDLWQANYMYHNAEEATKAFDIARAAGFTDPNSFQIIRKTDEQFHAMKRIVWDNEHQSNYLAGKTVPPRWKAETADWTTDNAAMPKAFAHAGGNLGWLRYRHLIVDDFRTLSGATRPVVDPVPIDNFLGYNGEWDEKNGFPHFVYDRGASDYKFWVGDLMIECQAKISDANAEVVLELSKGENRFQAKFANGKVALVRTGKNGKEMGTFATKISGPGTYKLRFANVDCSLRVWVDGRRIDMGAAGEYAPTAPDTFDAKDEKHEGWTTANDVEAPASIGASQGVEVTKLKLWRDSYFIGADSYASSSDITAAKHTYYVQPGHYLCLGDNSAQSSDGRVWGTVPDRLMLGRAAFVFFPLDRIGFIK